MAEESETHKAAGNDFFKSGEYLKAAASYTKAIKLQPDNHVYYSNRSQATACTIFATRSRTHLCACSTTTQRMYTSTSMRDIVPRVFRCPCTLRLS